MSHAWSDTSDGELLERLSVASGAMMFIVNLKPKTLWVNDALVETTGYTLEDYHFERFENPFIPVEDVARVVAALGRFLASDSGVSEVIRNRFVDRWGGTLHVRSRITHAIRNAGCGVCARRALCRSHRRAATRARAPAL